MCRYGRWEWRSGSGVLTAALQWSLEHGLLELVTVKPLAERNAGGAVDGHSRVAGL